jgi:hypothetical protein
MDRHLITVPHGYRRSVVRGGIARDAKKCLETGQNRPLGEFLGRVGGETSQAPPARLSGRVSAGRRISSSNLVEEALKIGFGVLFQQPNDFPGASVATVPGLGGRWAGVGIRHDQIAPGEVRLHGLEFGQSALFSGLFAFESQPGLQTEDREQFG